MTESPEQIELRKRQVEAQLDDYAQAIADYAAFMERWRAGQPQREAAE